MRNITKDKKWTVYIHVNLINNKKYVGITSKNPKNRWNNGIGYKSNIHFWNSIKKYGWNNFKHIIVAENLDIFTASEKEKELISKFNSNNPEYGYNLTNGGETNILSKESLEKISKANKGRKISQETKNKRALNPPKAIKVICEGKEFISITECAKYYGVKPKMMCNWLFYEYYLPEFFAQAKLHIIGESVEYQEIFSKRKWIFCDGKEFPSIPKFCDYYGLKLDATKHWIYGHTKMPEYFKDKNFVHDYKKFYKIIRKGEKYNA